MMIKERVHALLEKPSATLYRRLQGFSARPFLTARGKLVGRGGKRHWSTIMKLKTAITDDGGTSDGRFHRPYGSAGAELGPQNATIHTTNV